MKEYSNIQEQARKDVDFFISMWYELLTTVYDDIVDYAYYKGSAAKEWDSLIDYVPVLSDVDLHIHLADEKSFYELELGSFQETISFTGKFNSSYFSNNVDHVHLPRLQLGIINQFKNDENYIPPRKNQVRLLKGEFPGSITYPPVNRVRRFDRALLLDNENFIKKMPLTLIDKAGSNLELWSLLRKMNWRISPAPVRLLSQLIDDPYEAWVWNRSKIVSELKRRGFDKLSAVYTDYYLKGWEMFSDSFKSTVLFLDIIDLGRAVLVEAIERIRETSSG